MQKRMKVAVMVASLGFMTVGHADNLPSGKTTPAATSTTTTTTTTLGKEGTQATTSTTDQVLVGGSASSQPSQTSNTQSLANQHDHGHDEDMD